MNMFCYQCEQTSKGMGCTLQGVCGKDAVTAALQDLLVHVSKGISMYARRARDLGASDQEVDVFIVEALFSTITNVNFDAERIRDLLMRGVEIRDKAEAMYKSACHSVGKTPETLGGPAVWQPTDSIEGLATQGEEVSTLVRREKLGATIAGLQDLLLFGLKGAAAYADHAQILGKQDDSVYAEFHRNLDFLTVPDPSSEELIKRCLAVGELNLKAMELLDAANTEAYGHPMPTKVRITPVRGKAILVSGHDLRDLAEILRQTEGMGINVYTHGEMLPAYGYPHLKAYEHLVGNYGGAWQDQIREFDEFPGAIVMTTNCLQRPRETYKSRIFTSGLVAWPGVPHIANRDFGPVIEAALAAQGFLEDGSDKAITVGFAHEAIMSVADKLVSAIKSGTIRHIFLIGGCDGAKSGRNYYTEFAQAVPKDALILTLACGKYRFNKLEFGDIGGIPRLLDIGQCNDTYSAIRVAQALASTFEYGVNDLPFSLVLSWYEQKAVAILLTLLYLGIKNIRLGPSLPAFVTPEVFEILHKEFGIRPISTPEEDLAAILAR